MSFTEGIGTSAMLIRKDQNLSQIQTEVFDIIVGIEEEKQQAKLKQASEKSLTVG